MTPPPPPPPVQPKNKAPFYKKPWFWAIVGAVIVIGAISSTLNPKQEEVVDKPATVQEQPATKPDPKPEPKPEPKTEPATTPEPEPAAAQEPETTVSQRNALRAAKNYLSVMPFSHSGLVKQLEYEGYSTEDATYGADNCGADWFEQAEKKAADYLELMPYSRDGLIQQLEYEGFTPEQAAHGADKVGL